MYRAPTTVRSGLRNAGRCFRVTATCWTSCVTKPPAITRVQFNRDAKRLRAEDNLPALKALAVKLVGSPRNEDLRQVLAVAATEAVTAWWNNGGKLPHGRVMK